MCAVTDDANSEEGARFPMSMVWKISRCHISVEALRPGARARTANFFSEVDRKRRFRAMAADYNTRIQISSGVWAGEMYDQSSEGLVRFGDNINGQVAL